MAGTAAGAAKRARCSSCGAFQHRSEGCPKTGPKTVSLEERMAEVRGAEHECWEWRWNVSVQGYAMLNKRRVGRLLLGLTKGDSRVARHRCDNTLCVNPAHLEVGTQADNMRDMVERGRSNAGPRHWNYQGA